LVNAEVARAVANREIKSGPQRGDPPFDSWNDAIAGEPELVKDLRSQPSYWLVPVQSQNAIVGAVRVHGTGQAVASIVYRQGSNVLSLSRAQILKRVAAVIAEDRGEQAGDLTLVHDGPPGREAWRVEVAVNNRITRWLFVTPGGIYERAVGAIGDLEA
jgi:hypothetical protein